MFTICLQFVHTLYTYRLYNVLKDKGKGYLKRVLKVNSMKRYIELNNVTLKLDISEVNCIQLKRFVHLMDATQGLAKPKRNIITVV